MSSTAQEQISPEEQEARQQRKPFARENQRDVEALNRRFEFNKRSQLFIRAHNKTLSVAAMRVSNEDCSPARIHG